MLLDWSYCLSGLGFAVWNVWYVFLFMRIGTCMSVTQKEMLCLNLWKQSQRVSDSFENMTVKIRFIHYKPYESREDIFLSMHWLK